MTDPATREREHIVAYLKGRWNPKDYGENWPVTYAILAIEAGDHLKDTTP